ncbi:MAG: hypothetical protein Q9O24_08825 [Gammaproteobacteria bacterium]|nr:hypothetical protein [Gammaproteobacteria bacterium]
MIARYSGFIFLLALLMSSGGAVASEYPPLSGQWAAMSDRAVDYNNPWRTRAAVPASEAQFVQPSGNPWLKGGRTQQTVDVYPQQGQAPQMMPVLPQRHGMKAWSSPQSFPFGWMP